jgi:hypothetical protein
MPTFTRKNTGLVLYYPTEPIPAQVFEQFPFWSLLTQNQQAQLEDETANLLSAQNQLGLSSIEIGQRLTSIRALLAPYKGAFAQLLQAAHFSSRTGRRYIKDYQRLLEYVTQPVLDVMKSHGFRLLGATRDRPLGEYTEAYTALINNQEPPPAEADEEAALSYVTKLELQHERLKADPKVLSLVKKRVELSGNEDMKARRNSPDFLLKQNHYLLKSSLRRIPSNQRDTFLEKHVGYALTLRGVSRKSFEAQAIPSRYNLKPGRPTLESMEG